MKTLKAFVMSLAIAASAFAADAAPKNKEENLKEFVLEKAKAYTEKAEMGVNGFVSFVEKEAPVVASEFLQFRFFKHSFAAGSATALMAVLTTLLAYMLLNEKVKEALDGGNYFVAFICFVGVVLIFSLTAYENIVSAVQIKIAPRVYLLENLAKLVK